jgi:2,3-dihydroxybenzoate-AMP ligase
MMLTGTTPWPADFAARYRDAGYWRGETFTSMLRERAAAHGDRLAVVDGRRRWTYQDLEQRAERLAEGLRSLGVRREDRVVVQLPNIAEFFEVCFACFRIGAIPVFALPSHRASEITYFCQFADAVAYVIPARHGGFDYRALAATVRSAAPTLRHVIVVGEPAEADGPAADGIPAGMLRIEDVRAARLGPLQPATPAPAEQPGPQDVAFLQLSGGSTGVPKLIPRTHDDYIYTLRQSAAVCGLDQDSVYLGVLPISHNFPLSSPGVFGALYAGARVVLAGAPSPDVAFPLIASEGVTITALVPALALSWLEAAEAGRFPAGSSLRVVQIGGAALSPQVAARVGPAFNCLLQQVFGMAEGLVNYTRLDDPPEVILGTQGRPMCPDDEIRIVDDEDREVPPGEIGHLLTRGPYTIRGYYRANEHNARAFTTDGFYRTGDLVRRTPEGNLVVSGRAKDLINRGGDKVSAEEIENHLLAHPGVFDAAVVAMPDPFLGERTCAFVIPRGQAPTPLELKAFVRERGVAPYKVPDKVRIVSEFPTTGVGKVSKKQLRASLAEAARAQASGLGSG